MQGEKDSKFPMIFDQSRNKMFSAKLDCCFANSEILQHDGVKDNDRWSSELRKNFTFYEKHKMMKLGKFKWIKVGRMREQSPHQHNQ